MSGDQIVALRCLAHQIRRDVEGLIFLGFTVRPFSPRWSGLLDEVIVLQENLDELEALHGRRAA